VEEEALYFKQKYAETAKQLVSTASKFKLWLLEGKSTSITPPSSGKGYGSRPPNLTNINTVTNFANKMDEEAGSRIAFDEPNFDIVEIDNID
jgi:hypothetical protein